MITEFKSGKPVIPETAFIAHSADIIGNVEIGEFASVWFNAVIRGDMAGIRIGERTNIQDNTVIHTDPPLTVHIGNDVTVGHGAILHGCKIGNNVLIGMNATVLDGAEIGDNSIVGANALIPPGKKFPAGSVIFGVPGKVRREITDNDIEMIRDNAAGYVGLAGEYKSLLF
jgi:carbonic anhydrase/acetyltransferase-like protein (isoleucine patch superfamily)